MGLPDPDSHPRGVSVGPQQAMADGSLGLGGEVDSRNGDPWGNAWWGGDSRQKRRSPTS